MSLHEDLFFGPWGALNPSGDLILETRAWRDKLFASRETPDRSARAASPRSMMRFYGFMFPGGMGGGMGGMALNQLLVVMDGIDNPPFFRRVFTNRTNTLLDASFIVPAPDRRKVAPASRAAARASEQVYFIGATNVPIDRLDPALIRPGRMGRHVWFRTPTKHDRLDIIDLYINKVSHDPDLDMPRRRDEIARVTNGYSPAMIEQVTSMALTIAHHSGRERFSWEDLVESITTLESGTAIGIEYIEREGRAIAIHEAGHAIAGHAFMKDFESTRLSIRRRGDSGGHHQAREKEERFARFQSEMFAPARLGARRDGRRARLLQRELDRCRRRRHVGRPYQTARHGRRLRRWARSRSSRPRRTARPRSEARQRVARAPRGDRAADHEPDRQRRRPDGARPGRRRALGSVQAARSARQIIGQAYVVAHNLATTNRDAAREDRGRPDGAEGDLRRRAARPPRLRRDPDPRARLRRRGDLAGALLLRLGAPSGPDAGSSRADERPSVERQPARRGASRAARRRTDRDAARGARAPERLPPPVRASSTSRSRSSPGSASARSSSLLAKPGRTRRQQVWSRWQPDGSDTARVRQIADHVSTRYRFAGGDQLVVALAGPPTVTAGGGPGDQPDPRPRDRRPARHVDRQGRGRRHHARRRLEEHPVRALRPRRALLDRPGPGLRGADTRSSGARRSSSRSTPSSTSTTSTR